MAAPRDHQALTRLLRLTLSLLEDVNLGVFGLEPAPCSWLSTAPSTKATPLNPSYDVGIASLTALT